jgi:hypothetical protein
VDQKHLAALSSDKTHRVVLISHNEHYSVKLGRWTLGKIFIAEMAIGPQVAIQPPR